MENEDCGSFLNQRTYEVFQISQRIIEVVGHPTILVRISNLTPVVNKCLLRAQRQFQSTLTYAFSRERLAPINTTLQAAKKLGSPGLPLSEVKKTATQIVNQSEQMLIMTQSQMFHFEADCGTLKPKYLLFPRHLKDYLDQFLCIFDGELQRNKQQIDYIFPSNEDIFQFIKIDHDILRANLFLLVQNAVRHGERNSTIRIHLELDDVGMAEKKLTVAVSNACACVEEEAWVGNLKPLFAFSRQTKKDSKVRSGAGIGLSTVHAVTKALDCDFWVELNQEKKQVSAVF